MKKQEKIIIIILIITFICLFTLFQYKENNFSNIKKGSLNSVNNNVTIKEEEKEVVKELNLVMVGDAILHKSVYNDALRLANWNGYNFEEQLSIIKPYIENYDLAYYNQETILGGTKLGLSDYPTFNSPQEFGDAMIKTGFNLVSLATNHTMDRRVDAVKSSRTYWNSQRDVHAVGSYTSYDEKNEIETSVLTKNDITYAILNYTYGTNGMPVYEDYYVNVWPTDLSINNINNDSKYQEYKNVVKESIQKIRDKVDILIVAMHWGVEYTHTPTAYEKDMAKFLADNNVDIVIGTHPHVIQPVEWIDNTLVFYSLGNFISAQYQNDGSCKNYKCVVGLMSSLNIKKTIKGNQTKIEINNIENDLIYTYYSNWRNFKVIPFSSNQIKDYLKNYEEVYNTYSEVIKSQDERIHTKELMSEGE